MLRRLPPLLVGAVALVALGGCTSGADGPGADAGQSASTAAIASATGTASATPGVITITTDDVPMPDPAVPVLAADAPARIVSLATGVGETLAALGLADRVVGRDETSDVPAIDAAPVVTKAHAVSAENVLSLRPDLVLADDSTSPPEALQQIREAGVRVVDVPEAWTIADIGPRTHAVADATGVPAADADAVVAEASGTPATSAAADAPRVAFLYLRGTSAIYLVGGAGSGADAMIAAAGGVDAGAAAGYDGFVPLTAEALATLDPDVLLVMTKGLESVDGVDGLVELPGVAQTRAGQERRVVAVDDTLLLSFGPRTGRLAQALSAAIAEAAG